MADPVNLNDIDNAISALGTLAEFYFNNTRGPNAYDRYRDYKALHQRAETEMRRLSSLWSGFRDYERSRGAEYDRYVTRAVREDDDGCSCHISPPCSYCTRQADADDPELANPETSHD